VDLARERRVRGVQNPLARILLALAPPLRAERDCECERTSSSDVSAQSPSAFDGNGEHFATQTVTETVIEGQKAKNGANFFKLAPSIRSERSSGGGI
jgi:hypothetical protein